MIVTYDCRLSLFAQPLSMNNTLFNNNKHDIQLILNFRCFISIFFFSVKSSPVFVSSVCSRCSVEAAIKVLLDGCAHCCNYEYTIKHLKFNSDYANFKDISLKIGNFISCDCRHCLAFLWSSGTFSFSLLHKFTSHKKSQTCPWRHCLVYLTELVF